tara:strand:- start:390 stop:560 length:171 start_codon:yes stop_codon:yes gene_type:complete
MIIIDVQKIIDTAEVLDAIGDDISSSGVSLNDMRQIVLYTGYTVNAAGEVVIGEWA